MSSESVASVYHAVPQDAETVKVAEMAQANPYQHEARPMDSSSQLSREPVEEDPRRRSYWVASLVLTAVTLVLSLGTIATAAVKFAVDDGYNTEEFAFILPVLLYILSMVEAALCLIAMITCLALLACRPRAVLIRDGSHGGFVCLCFSVFVLFLISAYSFCVPIILASINRASPASAALCIIPGVRCLTLLAFFAVLIANSKL